LTDDNVFDSNIGSDYPVAQITDTKKLWDSMDISGSTASMVIKPEYLYDSNFSYGVFGRDEVYPIVTAITVFIVTTGSEDIKYEDINKLSESPSLSVSEKLTYVTKDGPDEYF
jgi:hypothetical protein